jgi:hypothetical protein
MKVLLKKFHLTMLYLPLWGLGENVTSYLKMGTLQEKPMCVLTFCSIDFTEIERF